MSEKNKQIVLRFIEAMGNGDKAAFAACLAPDAFAVAKGHAKISGRRDHDMMVNSVQAFKELWPGGLRPVFKSVIAEDDQVAVEFEGNAKLPNGVDYKNQYVMVFKLRDGKIKSVHEYFCTLLADQVMYPVLLERGLIPS